MTLQDSSDHFYPPTGHVRPWDFVQPWDLVQAWYYCPYFMKIATETQGLASQCKAQEKYKERLDLGVTWLKWLPTGMESKTRLAPRSNKVNSQKLTLDWNTSLCYRVIWKWRQSAFHANNHAIGGGSNGIIHLGWRPHTFLLHTNIDSTNSNTNRTNITEMAFKRFAIEIRLLLLKKCSHWKRWSTITSTGRTD